MYVSYFTMSGQEGVVDLIDQAGAASIRFTGYTSWFIRRLEALQDDALDLFHNQLNEIDKSHLSFE